MPAKRSETSLQIEAGNGVSLRYNRGSASLSYRRLLTPVQGVLRAAAEHKHVERPADERPLWLYEHAAQAARHRGRSGSRGRMGRGDAGVQAGDLPRVQGAALRHARGAQVATRPPG